MPNSVMKQLLHPVALISLLIVLSVFVLIGAAIFGFDQGDFVRRMGEPKFARGIITYLFAVTTIGTAVVLMVAALTGGQEMDTNFNRGKDILSLLLGVFGTIVGFYFGAEAASPPATEIFDVSPIYVSEQTVEAGGATEFRAFASGGTHPYEYSVTLGAITVMEDRIAERDGWIVETITIPIGTAVGTQEMLLIVVDGDGSEQKVEQEIMVTTQPPE